MANAIQNPGHGIGRLDDLRTRNHPNILDYFQKRQKDHEDFMRFLRNTTALTLAEIAPYLGSVTIINQYGGTTTETDYVRRFINKVGAPTVNDDSTLAYRENDEWLTTTKLLYICHNPAAGSADWREYGSLSNAYPQQAGTVSAPGVSHYSARDDHAHQVDLTAQDHGNLSGLADADHVETSLNLSDNTTNNAGTAKHGFAPKAVAPAANELNVLGIGNGELVYSNKDLFNTTNPANLGTVGPGTSVQAARSDHIHDLPALDALDPPTDITTLNASTSAHGLMPKVVAPGAGTLSLLGIVAGGTVYTNQNIFDAVAPANLGVASAGTALIAARRDHVHDLPALDALDPPTDITTLNAGTAAHGLAPKVVVPAAGVLNVLGVANGETAYTNKGVFDSTTPAAIGTAAAGTLLIAAHRDHVHAGDHVNLANKGTFTHAEIDTHINSVGRHSNAIFFHNLGNVIPASTTHYSAPGIPTLTATLSIANGYMIRGGAISPLKISTGDVQPASGSLVATVRVNNVATSCVVTIPANGAAGLYSSTEQATFSAGDYITIYFKNNATSDSAPIYSFAFEVEYENT